jgi:hypothetical protein
MSIGGYFELELPCGEEYHQGAIRLNTGRNAFEPDWIPGQRCIINLQGKLPYTCRSAGPIYVKPAQDIAAGD